jgi:hypothetical protein
MGKQRRRKLAGSIMTDPKKGRGLIMNPHSSPERPCSDIFIGGAYFIHENRFGTSLFHPPIFSF